MRPISITVEASRSYKLVSVLGALLLLITNGCGPSKSGSGTNVNIATQCVAGNRAMCAKFANLADSGQYPPGFRSHRAIIHYACDIGVVPACKELAYDRDFYADPIIDASTAVELSYLWTEVYLQRLCRLGSGEGCDESNGKLPILGLCVDISLRGDHWDSNFPLTRYARPPDIDLQITGLGPEFSTPFDGTSNDGELHSCFFDIEYGKRIEIVAEDRDRFDDPDRIGSTALYLRPYVGLHGTLNIEVGAALPLARRRCARKQVKACRFHHCVQFKDTTHCNQMSRDDFLKRRRDWRLQAYDVHLKPNFEQIKPGSAGHEEYLRQCLARRFASCHWLGEVWYRNPQSHADAQRLANAFSRLACVAGVSAACRSLAARIRVLSGAEKAAAILDILASASDER